MTYQFKNNDSLVSFQFINFAPNRELQKALKSKIYHPHCQVKLNSKKEVLQKELIRINKLIGEQQASRTSQADEPSSSDVSSLKEIKNKIATYLKIDRDLIAYAVDCPVDRSYEVDLKDGQKYEVTYEELDGEGCSRLESISNRRVESLTRVETTKKSKKILNIAPKTKADIKPIKIGTKLHKAALLTLEGCTISELAQLTGYTTEVAKSTMFYTNLTGRKGYGIEQKGDKFYLKFPEGVDTILLR